MMGCWHGRCQVRTYGQPPQQDQVVVVVVVILECLFPKTGYPCPTLEFDCIEKMIQYLTSPIKAPVESPW